MLLMMDIGNTRISFAVYNKKKIELVGFVDSTLPAVKLKKHLSLQIKKISKNYPSIRQVIICSVVPQAVKIVSNIIDRQLKLKSIVIGKDIKVPIRNKYRNPQQVGMDRLVCAYAAMQIYGKPAIIIDLGTAITLDVVSSKGDYEGGLIIPGIRLSAESLYTKTALLPRIEEFHVPKDIIGKDTKESILSGLFYGYGTMCCGLIDTIAARIKGKPKVVVTGGHTRIMQKFIRSRIDGIDKLLIFKGMFFLSKNFSKK